MTNIDKGVQQIKSLEEKKGTMNSEYFGISMSSDQSNKGICTTPIRSRLQGKMDALNASDDLLNAGATYHSLCKTKKIKLDMIFKAFYFTIKNMFP